MPFKPLTRTNQITSEIIASTSFRSKCGELLSFVQAEFPQRLRAFEKRFHKKEYHVDIQLLRKRRAILSKVCATLTNDSLKAFPCGSIASGLMSPDSDLDVVMVPIDEKRFLDRYEKDINFKRKNLYRAHDILVKTKLAHESFREVLPWARVPIVRMLLKTGDHLDVQFQNAKVLKSTNFVRVANNLDHRLFMLRVHLVKELTENALMGSQDGKFSSFNVTSLLIHFLQIPFMDRAVYPPLLSTFPILHPDTNWKTIAYDVKNNRLYDGGENFEKSTDSIGALYVKLVDYFSGFNFQENALEISNGNVLRKKTPTDQVEMLDMYFPGVSTCRVKFGADLLTRFFTMQRKRIEEGKLS